MNACKRIMERLPIQCCTVEASNSLFLPPYTLQQLSLNAIVNDARCRWHVWRRFSLPLIRLVLQYLQNCDIYLRYATTVRCLCGRPMGRCSCIFHWTNRLELLIFKCRLTGRLVGVNVDENDNFVDFEDRMDLLPFVLRFPFQPFAPSMDSDELHARCSYPPSRWRPIEPRDWLILMNYPYVKRAFPDDRYTVCYINKYRCRTGPRRTPETLCYRCYVRTAGSPPCINDQQRSVYHNNFLRKVIWDESNWCDRCRFQPLFVLMEELN